MTRRHRSAIAFVAAGLGACATPAIEPGKLVEVREQPVPAFELHEACVRMQPGDRLEYRFEAKRPVAFNIHYHEGKVVVTPVVKDAAMRGDGAFQPLTAQDYCLTWEAGAVDTLLAYRVRHLPGGARK